MTKTVHVLLIDSFADWEPAILLAQLRSELKWNVVTVGVVDPEVRSMGGVRVVVDALLSAVDPRAVSALLVPGGQGWEQHERPAVTKFIRGAWDAGAPVGAICAGTTAVAHAGLLDDRAHTSNGLDYLKHWVKGYRAAAHYRDELAVRDGRLVTAPGNGYAEWSREMLVALGAMSEPDATAFYEFAKPKKATPVTADS